MLMLNIVDFTVIIFAYLLGSISTATIASKFFNLPDPRTVGSHNPGTTNVMRIGGKLPALCTLCGDVAKGAIPALITLLLPCNVNTIFLVLLASFIGHIWPIFFNFKGGKGVATYVGGIFVLAWPLGLILVIEWACILWITRYVSLASILASISVPIIHWYYWPNVFGTIILSIMSFILIFKHTSNIQRILAKTENKI